VEEYPERTDWDADTVAQHLDTVMTMFLAADVSSMVLTVATPLLFPLHFFLAIHDSSRHRMCY
jgi:hypothetical protein